MSQPVWCDQMWQQIKLLWETLPDRSRPLCSADNYREERRDLIIAWQSGQILGRIMHNLVSLSTEQTDLFTSLLAGGNFPQLTNNKREREQVG